MGLTRFFRRRYWDEERAHELDAYLEAETDENIARGMLPEEARYAAHRKLGNTTLIREEIYHMNSLGWLETLWQDARFALRMLRKNPGFTLLVTGLLALGIGATTVIFSLFDAVFLRPLPVRQPAELVRMVQYVPKLRSYSLFAYAYYEALRDHSTTLAARFGETGDYLNFGLSDPEPAEEISLYGVTPEFFTALGVQALYGRVLLPNDAKESPGHAPRGFELRLLAATFQGGPRRNQQGHHSGKRPSFCHRGGYAPRL